MNLGSLCKAVIRLNGQKEHFVQVKEKDNDLKLNKITNKRKIENNDKHQHNDDGNDDSDVDDKDNSGDETDEENVLEKSFDFSKNMDVLNGVQNTYLIDTDTSLALNKRRKKNTNNNNDNNNNKDDILEMIKSLKEENKKNREENKHLYEEQAISPFDSDFFDISDTVKSPDEYFTKYQIDEGLIKELCDKIKMEDEKVLDKYFSKMQYLLESSKVPQHYPELEKMDKKELEWLLEKTNKEISYFTKKIERKPIYTGEMLEATRFDIPPYCTPIKADIRKFDFKKLGEAQQFDVILMDPPWKMTSRTPSRGVILPYEQLSDEDILAIPVKEISSKGLLFMWVINVKISFALRILEKWGYKLVSTLVWIKTTKKRKLAKGNGYTLQHAKETCLIASKNVEESVIKKICSRPNTVLLPRKGTSQKPDVIHEFAEDLYPNGNYVEIFARRNNLRNHWVSIGNQL